MDSVQIATCILPSPGSKGAQVDQKVADQIIGSTSEYANVSNHLLKLATL